MALPPVVVPAEQKEYVKPIPSPRTRVGETEVQVTPEGTIDKKGVVSKDAERSLREQQESLLVQSTDDIFSQLNAGNPVTFDLGQGNVKTYDPKLAAFQGDKNIEAEMQKYLDLFGAPQGMPTDVMYAYKGGAESAPWLTDGSQREFADVYDKSRRDMNNILKPVLPDRDLRQVFIDEIPTGTFFNNVANRYKLFEEGTVDLASYIFSAPVIAAQAYGAAARKGTLGDGGLVEEFKLRSGRFEEYSKNVKNYIDQNSNIFNDIGTAEYINGQIHEALDSRFNKELISEDMYNNLAFEEVGGKKVRKQFVDQNTASQLIDLAFTELPLQVQFGVVFAENAPFSGIFGSAKMSKAVKFGKAYKAAAERNNFIVAGRTPESAYKALVTKGLMDEFDNDIVELGFYRLRTSGQRVKLEDTFNDAQKRMNELTNDLDNFDPILYNEAKVDYINARRSWIRSQIVDNISPYYSPGIVETSIVSTGQLAGRYMFESAGLNPEIGEAAGAIGSVFLLNPVKGGLKYSITTVGKAVGSAGEKALNLVPAATSGGMFISGVNWVIKTAADVSNAALLKDDAIRNYEDSTFIPTFGRPMTMKERGQIKQISKFYAELPVEDQRKIAAGLEYTNSVYERFMKAFPAGSAESEEARRLFLPAFSQATLMPALAGASLDSLNSLSVHGMPGATKFARNVLELNERITEDSRLAKVALDNFEKNVLPNTPLHHREALSKAVDEARKLIYIAEDGVVESMANLNEKLDKFQTAAGRTLGSDLPDTYVSDMLELKIGLKEKELGRVLNAEEQRSIYEETEEKFFNNLNERLDNIYDIKSGNAVFAKEYATAMEDLFLGQMDFITKKADAAYSDVRKYGGSVDIRPAVERMMDIADTTEIDLMFGPEGIMFNSIVGKRSRKVFEQMIVNSLKKIDKDAMSFYEGKLVEAKVASAEQIAEKRKTLNGRIELGLIMHQVIDEVNIFNGVSLNDADMLRRAFRDAGYSSKTPGIGKAYKEFEFEFDELISNQDEEGFKLLSNARTTYQDLIGDSTRSGGTFAVLNKSQSASPKVTMDANDPYKFYYSTKTPEQMLDNIVDAADNLIRRRGRDLLQSTNKFNEEVVEIVRGLGGRIKDDSGATTVGFDLTTKAGKKKFETVSKIISQRIYNRWASDILNVRPGVRTGQKIGQDLFFESEKLNLINDNMMVSVLEVVDGKKQYTSKPLIDLTDIYHQENDIINFIIKKDENIDKFNGYVENLSTEMGSIKSITKNAEDIKKRDLRLLEALTNTTEPIEFLDSFIVKKIAGKGGASISDLRKQFVTAKINAGGKEAEAISQFNEYVQSITLRGLLQKGGFSRGSDTLVNIATGKKEIEEATVLFNANIFKDIGGMLEILTDPVYQDDLLEVFDSQSLDFLTDMSILIQEKAAKQVAVTGVPRGISLESLISKAYNWRRGMVGTPFLATEIGLRLLQSTNSTVMLLALQNKDAARIMRNVVKQPDIVSAKDWRTMDIYMKEFLATEFVKLGYDDVQSVIESIAGEEGVENVEAITANVAETLGIAADKTAGFTSQQLAPIIEQTLDSEGIYDEEEQ